MFAIPRDSTMPQIGPFPSAREMGHAANAAFGKGAWDTSEMQVSGRDCIPPEDDAWKAIVLARVIRDPQHKGDKVKMLKAYRNAVGGELKQAHDAVVAALDARSTA